MQNNDMREIRESRINYRQVDGRDLSALVFEPTDSAEDSELPRPAVLFFHGGGWVGGKPEQFTPFAQYLAARGAVCFSFEYRLIKSGGKVQPQDCLDDAVGALQYVVDHAEQWRIDPHKIAVGGGSAGGHLATALVTLVSDPPVQPAALLLYNPALDISEDGWKGGAVQVRRAGGEPMDFSPADHVDHALPPTVIFHGTEDTTVPLIVIHRFRDRARQAGGEVVLHEYEGRGHGFFNAGRAAGDYEQIVQLTAEFLREHDLLPTLSNT